MKVKGARRAYNDYKRYRDLSVPRRLFELYMCVEQSGRDLIVSVVDECPGDKAVCNFDDSGIQYLRFDVIAKIYPEMRMSVFSDLIKSGGWSWIRDICKRYRDRYTELRDLPRDWSRFDARLEQTIKIGREVGVFKERLIKESKYEFDRYVYQLGWDLVDAWSAEFDDDYGKMLKDTYHNLAEESCWEHTGITLRQMIGA